MSSVRKNKTRDTYLYFFAYFVKLTFLKRFLKTRIYLPYIPLKSFELLQPHILTTLWDSNIFEIKRKITFKMQYNLFQLFGMPIEIIILAFIIVVQCIYLIVNKILLLVFLIFWIFIDILYLLTSYSVQEKKETFFFIEICVLYTYK